MNAIAEYTRDVIETILLVLIFVDGRKILQVEIQTLGLYTRYFAHRQEERDSKLAQLAAARASKEAKAAKKIDVVEPIANDKARS